MKPTLPDRSPTSRSVASMREYYSRVLAYIACGASIAAGTYTQYFSYGIPLDGALCAALPAPGVPPRPALPPARPAQVTRALLAVDAVHCGLGMALLGFSVVPSLMFLLVLSFTALVIGGLRLLGMALLVSASSALLVAVLVAPPLLGNTPVEVAAVSIPFCGLYICITAFFGHQQACAWPRCARRSPASRKGRAARAQPGWHLSPQVWGNDLQRQEERAPGNPAQEAHRVLLRHPRLHRAIRGTGSRGPDRPAQQLPTKCRRSPLKYGGTIDKFVGDCVMVFFGDPSTQGAKKDAVAAVSMGIAMRKQYEGATPAVAGPGITKPLEIRMGINTGYCTVGNFGADTRMDYTIIGREVNLASRLESASEAGEILISHETYSLIKDVIMCRDKGQIAVKGFSRPVQIYQVVDSRRDLAPRPATSSTNCPASPCTWTPTTSRTTTRNGSSRPCNRPLNACATRSSSVRRTPPAVRRAIPAQSWAARPQRQEPPPKPARTAPAPSARRSGDPAPAPGGRLRQDPRA